MGAFSADLRKIESDIVKLADKLGKGADRTQALERAGNSLKDAMVQRAPQSNRVVKRYKNGKLIATYHPGNLKRSIQLLDLRDKANVYVGVKIQPRGKGKGVFSGSNVDGYYAHFVEYGRRKRPFIRPAVDAVGSKVLRELENFVAKTLNARN